MAAIVGVALLVGLYILFKNKQSDTSAATTTPAAPAKPVVAKPAVPAATGGSQIYPSGGKRRVKTTMTIHGGQCASAGIRFYFSSDKDLVNRETTWVYNLHLV